MSAAFVSRIHRMWGKKMKITLIKDYLHGKKNNNGQHLHILLIKK